MPPEFAAPATLQLDQQFAIVPKLKSAHMAAEFTPLDVTEPLMPRFFNYGAVARHLAEEALIVGRAVYVQILERIALTVEYSLERLLHRADRSPRGSACGRVA